MKKKNILFDLDNTLLDYQFSDRHAISKVYEELGLPLDTKEYKRYYNYVTKYWSSYENSKQEVDTHGMSKAEYIRTNLYLGLLPELNLTLEEAYELMKIYINSLGEKNILFDDVRPILDYLYTKYTLYIASNGPHEAQIRKLTNTGILDYFKGVVASEDAGFSKPKREYYDYLFKQYSIIPHESVAIGDTITTDILGANNAGIYSIWYNRNHEINTTGIKPDEEIKDIKELKKIL